MIVKSKIGLILTLMALWFMAHVTLADAANYFVGPGGNQLCSGTKDVPYSITDNVNCRFQHPFRALGPGGTGVLKGGDVLDIEGTYDMGYGAMSGIPCNAQEAYNCYMRPIPSGTSAQPTKIISKNGAKLVGVERAFTILNLVGSNYVEINNIELTDGSACQETGPAACQRDTPPYGRWAKTAIYATDSSNVLLKNVRTHGLAYKGIWWGRIKDWTLEDSSVINNSFVGIDGDLGPGVNSSNSGTITFNRFILKGSGCGEKLDGTRYNCYSQDQLGGYGDGWGETLTGGDVVVIDSEFSENVSDNFDLLYHNGQGKITIKNSKFENASGNQLKLNLKLVTIENSILTGDCQWYKNHPQYLWQPATYNSCRADGDALAVGLMPGSNVQITNTQFKQIKHWGILSVGTNCDGVTKITADKSTTFELLPQYNNPSELARQYYADGSNGTGPCKNIPLTIVDAVPPATDTTPPIISQVSSGTPTQTSATISWILNENGTGQVEYGPTTSYGTKSEFEPGFLPHHAQNLLNLAVGTTYHFQIKSKDQAGNEGKSTDATFKTTGTPICVPDNSCANVACGKTCTDNCGTVFNGAVCPAGSCTVTTVVPIACDQVKVQVK